MMITTYDFPLPNNGERYDLSQKELTDLLDKAYRKGFEIGNIVSTTTSASSLTMPCPWCGEMPIFKKVGIRGYSSNYEYYMECRKCKAIAPQGKCNDIYCSSDRATDAAIEAWNKRGY